VCSHRRRRAESAPIRIASVARDVVLITLDDVGVTPNWQLRRNGPPPNIDKLAERFFPVDNWPRDSDMNRGKQAEPYNHFPPRILIPTWRANSSFLVRYLPFLITSARSDRSKAAEPTSLCRRRDPWDRERHWLSDWPMSLLLLVAAKSKQLVYFHSEQ
jgi:hypothetical protein